MKTIIISLLKGYQFISRTFIKYGIIPLIYRSNCRFYPTCSEYAINSINEAGVVRGSYKGFIRILKCNPFYDGDL